MIIRKEIIMINCVTLGCPSTIHTIGSHQLLATLWIICLNVLSISIKMSYLSHWPHRAPAEAHSTEVAEESIFPPTINVQIRRAGWVQLLGVPWWHIQLTQLASLPLLSLIIIPWHSRCGFRSFRWAPSVGLIVVPS